MEEKLIVIQLKEQDMYRLLYLVQREATDGKVYNGDWERIANEMQTSIDAQREGLFFQCDACHQV